MKTVLLTLATLATPLLLLAQSSPFQEISESTAAANGWHTIDDGEVEIRDNRIKRLIIGKDNITIQFKAVESYKPNLTITLLDKYGLPLQEANESWMLNRILAGETKSHESYLKKQELKKMLRYSTVSLPGDAGTLKYLVLEYH